MNHIEEIWNGIMTLLKKEMTQTAVDTWFSSAELVDLDNNSAVICAANNLAKGIIEKRFMGELKNAFQELFCQEFIITIITGNEEKHSYIARKEGKEGLRALTLPAYSFDDYIVGESNKFAYMVAKTVADNPDDGNYNPIFIYGPAGTGKTHLLCSIALKIHEKYPGKKIEYINGDEFTNRLVNAIQSHTTEKFRDEFRNADVLILDNIQFIVGKPATQEEFYNTFNALYDAGKLIVMASDMAPREMAVLESRMRTRFESGIMADIKAPEESLRFNIIKAKSLKLGLKISELDISYFASKPVGSIRQLEGLLKSLAAYGKIMGKIDRNTIDEVLSRSVFESNGKTRPEDIIYESAKYFEVSPEQMKGLTRARPVSNARQVAMYLMRMELGMTLEDIGELFKRDHATVINSVKKIDELSHKDEATMKAISYIKKKLMGRVA